MNPAGQADLTGPQRGACNGAWRRNARMKKIEAIIKPFKLDEVKEALQEVGVQGLTRDRGQGLRPTEGPYRALSRRRIRRRFPAQGEDRGGVARRPGRDRAIEAIVAAANTGKIGDGKIFVLPGRTGDPHPHRRGRRRRHLTRGPRNAGQRPRTRTQNPRKSDERQENRSQVPQGR